MCISCLRLTVNLVSSLVQVGSSNSDSLVSVQGSIIKSLVFLFYNDWTYDMDLFNIRRYSYRVTVTQVGANAKKWTVHHQQKFQVHRGVNVNDRGFMKMFAQANV